MVDLTDPLVWIAIIAIVGAIFGLGQWKGKVDKDRKASNKFMINIGEKIDKLQEHVHKLLGMLQKVSKSDSPLMLTELGRKVAQCLDSKGVFQSIEPFLRDRVQEKQPYEIHEICFNYMHQEFKPSEEMDAAIRMCAYENGVKRKDVLEVMAIETTRSAVTETGGLNASVVRV